RQPRRSADRFGVRIAGVKRQCITPGLTPRGSPRRSPMTRTWFFTWRTYGTWLPGDDGFVGYFRQSGQRRILNAPPGEFAPAMPALAKYARSVMAADAVELTVPLARIIFEQLNETATFRQ